MLVKPQEVGATSAKEGVLDKVQLLKQSGQFTLPQKGIPVTATSKRLPKTGAHISSSSSVDSSDESHQESFDTESIAADKDSLSTDNSDVDSAGEGSEADEGHGHQAQPQPSLNPTILQKAKDSYASFLKVLAQLRQHNPEEYRKELQEVFSAALQEAANEAAVEEYIDEVVHAIDPRQTKHLFDRFVAKVGERVKVKSEFWQKLEACLDKWEDIITYSRTPFPIELAVMRRKIECYELRSALKPTKYNGARYYSDDKPVEVMEKILQTSQTYCNSFLGFEYNWAGGFNDFISELREINELRLANKLKSTNLSLFAPNGTSRDLNNVFTMVTVLLEKLSQRLEEQETQLSDAAIELQEADHFNKATFRMGLEKYELVVITLPKKLPNKPERAKLYIQINGKALHYTFTDLLSSHVPKKGVIATTDSELAGEFNYTFLGMAEMFKRELTPETVTDQKAEIVSMISGRGHTNLDVERSRRIREARENPQIASLNEDRRQLRVENCRLAAENSVLKSTHKAELKSMSKELENERSARAASDSAHQVELEIFAERLSELESELSELRSGTSTPSTPSSPNYSDSDASESPSPIAEGSGIAIPKERLDRVTRRLFADDPAAPKKFFDQSRAVAPVPNLDGLNSTTEQVVTVELY